MSVCVCVQSYVFLWALVENFWVLIFGKWDKILFCFYIIILGKNLTQYLMGEIVGELVILVLKFFSPICSFSDVRSSAIELAVYTKKKKLAVLDSAEVFNPATIAISYFQCVYRPPPSLPHHCQVFTAPSSPPNYHILLLIFSSSVQKCCSNILPLEYIQIDFVAHCKEFLELVSI